MGGNLLLQQRQYLSSTDGCFDSDNFTEHAFKGRQVGARVRGQRRRNIDVIMLLASINNDGGAVGISALI